MGLRVLGWAPDGSTLPMRYDWCRCCNCSRRPVRRSAAFLEAESRLRCLTASSARWTTCTPHSIPVCTRGAIPRSATRTDSGFTDMTATCARASASLGASTIIDVMALRPMARTSYCMAAALCSAKGRRRREACHQWPDLCSSVRTRLFVAIARVGSKNLRPINIVSR